MPMSYTDEEKLSLVSSVSKQIADTDKSVVDIAINVGVSIRTIYNWIGQTESLADIYIDGCTTRAHRYWHQMKEIVDNIEEFWTDHEGSLKERQQAVNKAKFRCEMYIRFASQLAPDIFSDRAKELKELQKDMEEIKRRLNEKK